MVHAAVHAGLLKADEVLHLRSIEGTREQQPRCRTVLCDQFTRLDLFGANVERSLRGDAVLVIELVVVGGTKRASEKQLEAGLLAIPENQCETRIGRAAKRSVVVVAHPAVDDEPSNPDFILCKQGPHVTACVIGEWHGAGGGDALGLPKIVAELAAHDQSLA